MSQSEIAASVAAFIANNGITRCPTACATRTTANPTESDRAMLAAYHNRQEQARAAKLAARQGVAA